MASDRLKNLYREYNNREAIIQNNNEIAKKCYKDLQIIRNTLSPKTMELINSYHPGLLDRLVLSETPSVEELFELKKSLEIVFDKLCTIAEGELY